MIYFVVFFVTLTSALSIFLVYVAQYSRMASWMRTIVGLPPATLSAVFLVFGLNIAFVSNDVWGTYD